MKTANMAAAVAGATSPFPSNSLSRIDGMSETNNINERKLTLDSSSETFRFKIRTSNTNCNTIDSIEDIPAYLFLKTFDQLLEAEKVILRNLDSFLQYQCTSVFVDSANQLYFEVTPEFIVIDNNAKEKIKRMNIEDSNFEYSLANTKIKIFESCKFEFDIEFVPNQKFIEIKKYFLKSKFNKLQVILPTERPAMDFEKSSARSNIGVMPEQINEKGKNKVSNSGVQNSEYIKQNEDSVKQLKLNESVPAQSSFPTAKVPKTEGSPRSQFDSPRSQIKSPCSQILDNKNNQKKSSFPTPKSTVPVETLNKFEHIIDKRAKENQERAAKRIELTKRIIRAEIRNLMNSKQKVTSLILIKNLAGKLGRTAISKYYKECKTQVEGDIKNIN